MIVGVYARVSTEEQAEHGTSLDEQVRLCRERAVSLGAGEVFEYVDAGLSGTSLDRPQLQALLTAVRQGAVNLVVTFDPDRLARNLTHLLLIVDEISRFSSQIEFVNFKADVSPDGRLLFAVRGAIAEFEAHKIKQRLYSGKQARAREGKVAGGTCIYGYRYDPVAKAFVEEPREAEVVRAIFDWARAAGTWEIARRLNEQGVPPRFSKGWAQSTVIGMLRNPTYLGRMPQMNGIGHVPVPQIVTEAAWERAQQALKSRFNRPPGPAIHPYLMTGHLKCSLCGRSMAGGYGRVRKSGYVTHYACSGKKSSPKCPSKFYRSDRIDEHVWGEVVRFVRDPRAYLEAMRQVAGAEEAAASLEADLESARKASERLEEERVRLLRAFRKGLVSEDDLAAQVKEIEAEAGLLRQRIDVMEARNRSLAAREEDVREAERLAAAVVADVHRMERLEDRKAVLRALRVRAILGPEDRVAIEFNRG